MPTVIGVMVRETGDRVYADIGCLNLKLSDRIILETEHGIELGVVCEKEKNIPKGSCPIGKVLRKATEDDEKKLAENKGKISKVYNVSEQKVNEHKLNMKLICVRYTFDGTKLFVYYTSETRIDFREFIKDLGRALKTRIQMIQIGVRDEAKIVGGIGICGRVLCCRSFLKDFNSVTIDMAKEQGLSINTAKLSGLCGRLMCCISYENDTYMSIKKELPEIGTTVFTPEGKAKVTAINCIKKEVTVDFGDNSLKIFAANQINNGNKRESE
ncbi:stage 0 sporulation family protein [Candidatus Endomicrobiellum agilis]|jgi:cell fate regulator YaaT (PSP1 superfamily)|uniref:PSP1 domain-containing protein n=1 Tax=Candidatus Endomicrobiellum agilis TaxID=3238957 RepID=UPI00284CA27F|nr:stage 0 sporulation protein [Endomicrobium sp.]MDR3092951.1 stage 0 sporulation protein [Endomicrobium sp.]